MLRKALKERVLLLDGAMGTEIQTYGLTESDFRGERFKDHPCELKGNNDILVLTRPDVISAIHNSYLDAGADIITTCSFNSQKISQSDYQTSNLVYELNYEAAKLARNCADTYMLSHPERECYVAGSVGPTTRLLSLPDTEAGSVGSDAEAFTFDNLVEAYTEQMRALINGGVDALLIETVLDPLNAKAALYAARVAMELEHKEVEIMLSMTVTDAGGRMLSGMSAEAMAVALQGYELLSVGLNCSIGAEGMTETLARLSDVATCYVSVHPNAGLPNSLGEYDETPELMAGHIGGFLHRGIVNIVGGCCGTTPAHISALRREIDGMDGVRLRCPISRPNKLVITGLDVQLADLPFTNVGERCNVAGSRKFLRLIGEKNYDEALETARTQIRDGAMAIDINMDDPLLDAAAEMENFIRLLAADAECGAVPVMIDSSDFNVVLRGLKSLQGKGIVNSISLKDGEEQFCRRAREIKRLGAAVVVMAFDERGQAVTYDRRIEICARSYSLLVNKVGFNPYDIIFDPNILTVATGMEEHLDYAYDYVRAAQWIRANLPGAGVSGGVSNLSFAFRGNNRLRETMHSVFLHHAVAAGMNMAILNPATSLSYYNLEPQLREATEDVLFRRRDMESTERLTTLASQIKDAQTAGPPMEAEESPEIPSSPEERLRQKIIAAQTKGMETDLMEALSIGHSPLRLISGPLMEGMNEVGRNFAAGKMFLPQVVKTARAMKHAVDILSPYLHESTGKSRIGHTAGKVLIATVKGDVHDIGKNIVAVVMKCNGYDVKDLGVMVSEEKIVAEALEYQSDIICLSGLITPSLEYMRSTLEALEHASINLPVMIGGAATSERHTAIKLAPHYSGPVVQMRDASQNPVIAAKLVDPDERLKFIQELQTRQSELRSHYNRRQTAIPTQGISTPVHRRPDWNAYSPVTPPYFGVGEQEFIPIDRLIELIDWRFFFHAWKMRSDCEESKKLRLDAEKMLMQLSEMSGMGVNTLRGFFHARSGEDEILIYPECKCSPQRIVTKRSRDKGDGSPSRAMSDYVSPKDDIVGIFAATISAPLVERLEQMKQADSTSYETLLLQTLCDRLVEAASEHMHSLTGLGGIRPAVGYPSLPGHENIFRLNRLINMESIGIRLTDTGAMYPQASVAGLYIFHPEAKYFDALI